ncbi:SatD family protein [Trueperella pecoris]|uniref:SatD family protein n=1 Tax=Trueperella pecoris TaxID=2733571 RepID=UPI00186BA0FA|nr:SatD family protein [Trueperella pecoris]QOQ38557.1 hypothetical protein HLG82_03215 [Trueperella pecoris]QTG74858.1 hypothetical protein J4179_06390 [Trueperella pecoris]
MSKMKKKPEQVAIIGDLVHSRGSSRIDLHEKLKAALAELPADAIEAFAPTVGDEIQGVFADLPSAIRSMHLLRLTMLAHGSDIRFGIGTGEITHVGDGIQDGSAWWHAREAIETVDELASKPGWAGVRTGLVDDDEARATLPTIHLIDAALTKLKPGACATLLGILRGETNCETAKRLGISDSANSQRTKSNDLRPLAAAMLALWPSGHDDGE